MPPRLSRVLSRGLIAATVTLFVVPAALGQYGLPPVIHYDDEPPSDGESSSSAPADSLEALRARIDELERQNREMQRRFDENGSASGNGSTGNASTGRSSTAGRAAVQQGDSQNGDSPEENGWYELGSDFDMTASWHHGFEVISKNGDFRVHVGGRIQFDGVWWADSAAFQGAQGAGDNDAAFFRRARFRIDGTMYEWIDWASEFDFVNSANYNQGLEPTSEQNVINVPAPTDLWVNFREVPYVGNVRVGNMKEPIGMEHLTSSRFLPFLERSFNQEIFYGPFNNGFTPGVMIWDTYADDYGTWATGAFKDLQNPFGYHVGDGDYAWTSRITYLLWYDEPSEGRSLFHIGASHSLRDPAGDTNRFRARPSLRNGPGPFNPVLADTGRFPVETLNYLGVEAAWNYGPLNVQAEYTGGFLDNVIGIQGPYAGRPIGNEFVHGGYIQALYFLTGEHMHYDRQAGVFARQDPYEDAYLLKGLSRNIFTRGAWQLGLRYAHLNLNSSDALDGGILDDWTVGLNWYLNPNMKLQGNYVATHRNVPPNLGEGGWIHGFGIRLAYDF